MLKIVFLRLSQIRVKLFFFLHWNEKKFDKTFNQYFLTDSCFWYLEFLWPNCNWSRTTGKLIFSSSIVLSFSESFISMYNRSILLLSIPDWCKHNNYLSLLSKFSSLEILLYRISILNIYNSELIFLNASCLCSIYLVDISIIFNHQQNLLTYWLS